MFCNLIYFTASIYNGSVSNLFYIGNLLPEFKLKKFNLILNTKNDEQKIAFEEVRKEYKQGNFHSTDDLFNKLLND